MDKERDLEYLSNMLLIICLWSFDTIVAHS